MKHMITGLAAFFTRIREAIDRMFEAHERAVAELRGTPAYVYLYEPRMRR